MANKFQRETVEVQPFEAKVLGVVVLTGVEVALTTGAGSPWVWNRDFVWGAPVSIEGGLGVMVQDLTVGKWGVWARITDSPEIPVIFCGSFTVV